MRISDWSSDVCSSDLLTGIVESQSVMLATLNMFAAITICFAVAATLIWVAPKPKGPIDTSGAHSVMHTPRVLPSPVHRPRFGGLAGQEIGRACCRARVCQNVTN